jgi:hypothetical protein
MKTQIGRIALAAAVVAAIAPVVGGRPAPVGGAASRAGGEAIERIAVVAEGARLGLVGLMRSWRRDPGP